MGFLEEYATEHGFKAGDTVKADGRILGRLDLREQEFDREGNPIPFDTPRYFCPICNTKLLMLPLLYKKGDKYVISGELAFHCYDTHGIPTGKLDEVLRISEIVALIPHSKGSFSTVIQELERRRTK